MFNKDKVKLGIAPIGWTNDDMPALGGENTFEQCVSEMVHQRNVGEVVTVNINQTDFSHAPSPSLLCQRI